MKYFFLIFSVFFTQNIFAQQGGKLFDDSFLHEIRISEMDTTVIDFVKEYQQVQITIDGEFLDSVGVKEKGNISLSAPNLRIPFKIKTNKYVKGQEYDEIKEFTLNNSYQDPTMMREKMTYDICAEMGLFSMRTAFAKLYINDVYWGLYTIVEGKDELFKHRFDNRKSDVMESFELGNMCYRGATRADYKNTDFGFEYYAVENGDETTTWERFISMLDKVNNTPATDYATEADKSLNLRDFFTYQAINVYLMNMDSYIAFEGNQIYVYDENEERFQVIPWDFNASFGLWNTNNFTPDTYPIVPQRIDNGCIASKINEVPEMRNFYMDAMCRLANEVCSPAKMEQIINKWKAQIRQAVYDDYRKDFTNQDFDDTLEEGFFDLNFEQVPALKSFFKTRFDVISNGLTDEQFSCMSPVWEAAKYFSISLSPNPTSGILFFQTKEIVENVVVFDTFGRRIKMIAQPKSELDLSDLPAGVYFISFEKEGAKTVERIVKE